MTPAELQSIATSAYGQRWQSQLARDASVPLRTVQRWAADGIHKPQTEQFIRGVILTRRTSFIPSPPAGTTEDDDRDDACHVAIAPSITGLTAAARDAGWSEAEALTAILAATLDLMRQGAGDAAVLETLRATILMLDE